MTRALRRERVLLASVLLLALVVRIWGIDFGLPNEHARPDERHLIGFTLTIGGNRLNPGFFNYPSLYLYALFTLYIGYYALGLMTGRYSSANDLVAEYGTAPEAFFLIDRALVALLGTATVLLVYLTLRRVAGTRAGLLAALLLSVCYLHVRESHFGTVDVPLTFMCTLATFLMLRALQAPSTKARLIAAFCVGLAISTKYNAVVLGLPLLMLFLSELAAAGQRTRARLVDTARELALAGLAVCIGFVLGTPYAVLDFATFSHDVMQELVDKGRTKPSIDLGIGYVRHALVTLPHGVGVVALLASLAGGVAALRHDLKPALLLLAFPLGWYLAVGQSHYVFVRYAVPLAPSICLFAAWGLELLLRRVSARSTVARWQVPALAAVCVSAALASSLFNVWQWNRLATLKDTRVLAAEWIERHVPTGSSVGLVGPNYIRPDLWATPAAMAQAAISGTTGQGRRLRNEQRIAFLKENSKPTFELATYQNGRWENALSPGVAAAAPTYVVVPEHPAWLEEPDGVPPVRSGYRLLETIVGFTHHAEDAVFDRQDAMYVPYARFAGVERPGPNLKLFQRDDAR